MSARRVVVLAAGVKRGYSAHDHYVTGRECSDAVGRSFASARQALRFVERMAWDNVAREVRGAPVWIRAEVAGKEVML